MVLLDIEYGCSRKREERRRVLGCEPLRSRSGYQELDCPRYGTGLKSNLFGDEAGVELVGLSRKKEEVLSR